MNRFNSLIEEAKEIYLLELCEVIIEKIANCEGYEITVEAIEKCWEWIKLKNIDADDLYFYLENLDEKDIMTYMQIDQNDANEPVWMCIANALAYIIRDAYQYEKQEFMPETIECVDDETIDSFFDNISKVLEGSSFIDEFLDYMLSNYSDKNSQLCVDILDIKKFVKNNMK
ncbi:MAG: hypothetical protein IJD58_13410 [Lachnospiraceae bacterium]|nr:hypothetical protein [Lachnospiraceae bacterium]MBQ3546361.1 hypothetical protein [Lachnospiraceae bacterium]